MGQKQFGNNQIKPKDSVREETKLTRNHFEFMYVIGKGGFGKVWKVVFKKFKKQYALKEMLKVKIIDKKSEKSVKYERELLARIKHPFIVNMQYAFQDHEYLYIVSDLYTGGDLRYHVSRKRKFTEAQTKFFMAGIILSLDHIHSNNILHRDIKPENLVLDHQGYVGLTDFGIAKIYQKENSSETSGTPGYMAPEVMCAQNHTIAVDYFALGILGYEFMMGKRPYLGKSRKEIKEAIMSRQASVKKNEIPEGWCEEAADFINKLLQRKPINRLGLRGSAEVKDHPWFKDYPWKDLYDKKVLPEYIPKVGDNFDKKYCEQPDKLGNETKERYEKILHDENFSSVFKDFLFYNEEFEQLNNLKPTAATIKVVKKEGLIKKDYLNESKSATSLIKKDNIKKLSGNPMPSLIIGNMLDKMKLEKSSSLIDNRILKLKKNTNSFSSSSLLKNTRQLSNLSSNTGSSTNRNLSNLSSSGSSIVISHKRTGSSYVKPISIGGSYKI